MHDLSHENGYHRAASLHWHILDSGVRPYVYPNRIIVESNIIAWPERSLPHQKWPELGKMNSEEQNQIYLVRPLLTSVTHHLHSRMQTLSWNVVFADQKLLTMVTYSWDPINQSPLHSVHSLIQQLLIERLVYTKYFSRHRGHSSEKESKVPAFKDLIFYSRRQTVNKIQ